MTGGTVGVALRHGARALEEAGIDGAMGDARRLLAAALAVAPGRLTLLAGDPLDAAASARFDAFLAARAARQPVAQIVGGRWFFGRWFRVTEDVLDPRPETETLVDLALADPFARVLDLGTGSGAIVVTLLAERPVATGVGSDVSAEAVRVAGENAAAHGVADRLVLPLSDWFDDLGGRFDLIVSNPPYIAAGEMASLAPEVRNWEPRGALTDGGDGLSAYRAIAAGAADHLSASGRLLVEIGATQGAAVTGIFRAAGFRHVDLHPDLDGRDRVVTARR